MATTEDAGHVLQFVAGDHKGAQLVLRDGTYSVGRGLDVAFTLDDETMSRRHAAFEVEADRIRVQDLGSTNGTYVNGVQVTGAVLKTGDAIVIGACLIKYHGMRREESGFIEVSEAEPRAFEQAGQSEHKTEPEALSGDLSAFPITTLAQLIATTSASGCLVIEGPREAHFYVDGGHLAAATFDGERVDARKAFLRALRWEEGAFVLVPDMPFEGDAADRLNINSLMLDGMRVIDELTQIPNAPELHERLFLAEPIVPPIRELNDEQTDTLQLVHNLHHVETVLDHSLASDLETLRDISELIERGYIVREAE